MTDDEIYAQWNIWLDDIHEDIRGLLLSRHVLGELHDIVKANPRIQSPGFFFNWTSGVAVTALAVGIRRHLDDDKRSVTLSRLLASIRANPVVMSRARFVGLYRDPGLRAVPSTAHTDFDQFAGDGQPHLDPAQIAADLTELQAVLKPIKRYTDKHVAHLDRRRANVTATYGELHAALDLLEKLLTKYLLMLRAHCYSSIVGTWQYDWKRVFRTRWIEPDPGPPPCWSTLIGNADDDIIEAASSMYNGRHKSALFRGSQAVEKLMKALLYGPDESSAASKPDRYGSKTHDLAKLAKKLNKRFPWYSTPENLRQLSRITEFNDCTRYPDVERPSGETFLSSEDLKVIETFVIQLREDLPHPLNSYDLSRTLWQGTHCSSPDERSYEQQAHRIAVAVKAVFPQLFEAALLPHGRQRVPNVAARAPATSSVRSPADHGEGSDARSERTPRCE